MFAVRTPTATVTDLGTEFGVEVNKAGRTQAHVFVGSVRFTSDASSDPNGGRVLRAGEAALVAVQGIVESIAPDAKQPPFIRAMPSTKYLAQLRADYDRHLAGSIRGSAGKIPDTAGSGHWNYYGCDNINPSAGKMIPLTWKTVGNANLDGYGGPEHFATPAIASTLLFSDGRNPPANELSLHPGDAELRAVVARWTAGADVAATGAIQIRGTIQHSASTSRTKEDGVHFYVYVNGILKFDRDIVQTDNKAYPFNLAGLSIAAGQNVDLVLDRKEYFWADESLLSATISVQSTADLKSPAIRSPIPSGKKPRDESTIETGERRLATSNRQ